MIVCLEKSLKKSRQKINNKMIKKKLSKNAQKIDKFLLNYLKRQQQSLLIHPMKYGVISGGKKIRSTIIMDVGKIFNISEKKTY